MERPSLPPPVPGRSALPSLLAFEAAVREQLRVRREGAMTAMDAARDEAESIRRQGEEALQEVVREAERQMLRTVESEARDRASRARQVLAEWLDAAEARMPALVEEAVARLTTPPGGEA